MGCGSIKVSIVGMTSFTAACSSPTPTFVTDIRCMSSFAASYVCTVDSKEAYFYGSDGVFSDKDGQLIILRR